MVRGGRQPQSWRAAKYYSANFSQKVHENVPMSHVYPLSSFNKVQKIHVILRRSEIHFAVVNEKTDLEAQIDVVDWIYGSRPRFFSRVQLLFLVIKQNTIAKLFCQHYVYRFYSRNIGLSLKCTLKSINNN